MASEKGPGSVISIGSSSDDEQPSVGTKRRREDDSDDETSSSGSSRSASPASRVDAVSMTRKGTKRQKGVQKSNEANNASSPEEGEMTDEDTKPSATRRLTRSQSQRAESLEKRAQRASEPPAAKAPKKSKKPVDSKFDVPSIPKPSSEKSQQDVATAWARTFIERNQKYGSSLKLNIIKNVFLEEVSRTSGMTNKAQAHLKRTMRNMRKDGSLLKIIQEEQHGQKDSHSGAAAESSAKSQSSKKAVSASSDSEEEYEPTLGTAIIDTGSRSESTMLRANGAAPSLANGNSTVHTSQNDEETLRLQRRYFPSASDPSSMCLLCGRSSHTAPACPHTTCQFCKRGDHADFSCPERERCGKCRQLGHASKSCPEKLALTRDEGLACSFCAASDHLEENCTQPWRSFHPEQEELHTVASILPSCSACGVEGEHYSGDCRNVSIGDVNPTWTMRNHSQYVDSNATEKSIEDVAAGALADVATKSRGPEMRIRGHAKTQHIQFHDSDSETEFLGHAPAKGRAPIGQIRMSSNIQMPSDSRGSSTRGRGSAHLPPLPRGPPPPGPPPPRQNGYTWQPPPPSGAPRYDSWSQAPPHSLPARPPPQNTYHHVPPPASQRQSSGGQSYHGGGGDSNRGGRFRGGKRGGGGGGRGRGRGRGK